MNQELYDWILLLLRWLHITTAVTWIGTSIFFMWLDRSFVIDPKNKKEGYLGELWMLHGGGFYKVEKLQMGPTKVPSRLHWFKWESYWTWMSGMSLLLLIFYSSNGIFLIDNAISKITFSQAIAISLFSIFASWFVYDQLWESQLTKNDPRWGHLVTLIWLGLMSYFLCQTLSGRAAYLHVGAMLGTWMAGNVFMRIIPRQMKMVQATEREEPINPEWSKNAKNRSTHNTYFTLPVIFIMLSNHFPSTYGHQFNWLILLILCVAGAAIREAFIVRSKKRKRSFQMLFLGVASLLFAIFISTRTSDSPEVRLHYDNDGISHKDSPPPPTPTTTDKQAPTSNSSKFSIQGVVKFEGIPPAPKPLSLPQGCAQKGQITYSNEILIKNNLIQNVLIRIVKGHESLDMGEIPTAPAEIDQKGCLYSPRVNAVRVGQEVVFINSDPTFHNVRSFSKENTNFNLSMPAQNQRISKKFNKAELFLETKCSIHPWMSAYIAVMDHPYYNVSDSAGHFEIKGLTPGKYTLEAWHEIFGTQSFEISISEKSPDPLTITYKK